MSAERVRAHLVEHEVKYESHPHPIAYTTSEVAEAEDMPGSQMAKAVMLMADDRLVMTVVPGDRMVDLEKAGNVLGAQNIRLAEEDEFAASFPDCERGAEPPFGALYDVPMLVDNGLTSPQITFNAGTHTETITMELGDYLELNKPERADLGR
ncbi:MAG: YbaK/EbsC family protein [Acidimicrobiia bacterium]